MSGNSRGHVHVSKSSYVQVPQLIVINSYVQSQTSLSKRPSGIPRRRSIPSSSTPLAIGNTSVRTQQRPLDPVQQPSNSQFQHARNVGIYGGQFTTESGPRLELATHVTINGVVQSVLDPKFTENGGQHPVSIAQPKSTLPQVCTRLLILWFD